MPLEKVQKNVAAQCSIIASNLQEEMESEPPSEFFKW